MSMEVQLQAFLNFGNRVSVQLFLPHLLYTRSEGLRYALGKILGGHLDIVEENHFWLYWESNLDSSGIWWGK